MDQQGLAKEIVLTYNLLVVGKIYLAENVLV